MLYLYIKENCGDDDKDSGMSFLFSDPSNSRYCDRPVYGDLIPTAHRVQKTTGESKNKTYVQEYRV